MATTTIKELAQELKRTSADLLDQLKAAGINKDSEDAKITEKDKTALLEHLQKEHGILAGIVFQKQLEQTAKQAGGGGQVAPAQRVADYVSEKISADLPETSYFPGLNSAPLHELLPSWITSRMREGLRLFDRQIRGYASKEALLLGFETRTSSPLRIPRRDDTLEHPQIAGLFPCGEGAGYAGGIVSAAMDGMRSAEAVCR